MVNANQNRIGNQLVPRSSLLAPRPFTLVELLVVITIIGILAALITTAAVGAVKAARRAEVKAELNQIDGGFNEFKNKTTAFPPNCQVDGSGNPINDSPNGGRVLADVKRFMKLAFPRHQEPDRVIARLCGIEVSTSGAISVPTTGKQMAGGMTAGEAVVFWLGGFSQDPKYPISGEGGPSYSITAMLPPGSGNNKLDPIESRKWVYPFNVERLGPRDSDGYFDETTDSANRKRYYEYGLGPNNTAPFRRINFWQYMPRKSQQPYMYFDTSRYAPPAPGATGVDMTDPPAATALTGLGASTTEPFYVFPFKKKSESLNASSPWQYINPDKFQIIHCGINDRWDHDPFKKNVSSQYFDTANNNPLIFPDGPFVGDMAEAIVNFTTETKIEDAQK